jgi:hypothetical protein
MTPPLTFCRFFRRIPAPPATATAAPFSDLVERYTHLLADKRNNQSPILHMYSTPTVVPPQLLNDLNATLKTGFRRPYTSIFFTAENNIQHLQPLQYTLMRQWVNIQPTSIAAVTILEPADHPLKKEWGRYWYAINDRRSTPPDNFWTDELPEMLCQDATGKIHWPIPSYLA